MPFVVAVVVCLAVAAAALVAAEAPQCDDGLCEVEASMGGYMDMQQPIFQGMYEHEMADMHRQSVYTSKSHHHSHHHHFTHEPGVDVDVVGLSGEEKRTFAIDAMAGGKPVVFEDSFVCDSWLALSGRCECDEDDDIEKKEKKKDNGWTPAFVTKLFAGSNLTRVSRSKKQVIMYFDSGRSLAKQEHIHWHPPHERADMPPAEFFKLAARSKEEADDYVYLSTPGDQLPDVIRRQIGDFDPFIVNESRRETASSNLWMGQGGVTAQTHYDSFHNFFTQIYGVKTFYLYPPSAWQILYLFPRLHPSYRQSQVPFDDEFATAEAAEEARHTHYPLFDRQPKMKPLIATLSPGDVLYLPPYWFHRVVAEQPGPSISVNVWTDSDEYLVAQSIMFHKLPFENDWTVTSRIMNATVFLSAVLGGKGGVVELRKQAMLLFQSRYSPINHLFGPFRLDCNALTGPMAELLRTQPPIEMRYAREIREKFFSIKSSDIRQIILFNFMEDVLEWALAGPGRVPALLHCYMGMV